MPNVTKHKFVSTVNDDADTSLVRPSNWNTEHAFTGGVNYNIVRRDTDATDGANWLDLTNHLGNVNVLESGAVGNGVTSDSSAISTAHALAVSLGRPLLFPAGKIYRMSGAFTFLVPIILINSQIKVDASITVTVAGEIYAGITQIFDANSGSSGTIRITKPSISVRPEWWGVDNSGVVSNAHTAYDLAIASLTNGGTVLGAGTWAIYNFGADPSDITVSNITLDFNYATLMSSGLRQFHVNGDSGVNGDRSLAVNNFIYRNARHGTLNNSSNRFSGPDISWANNTLIENLDIKGFQNGINVKYVNNGNVRNVAMAGCGDGQIGLLSLHSNYCTYQDIHFSDGAFGYVTQVKGGEGVVYRDCTARNIAPQAGFTTPPEVAFRNRGDAPWGSSSTGGTYPFTTGGFSTPDSRRASRYCQFSNLTVLDSPSIKAYEEQESFGTIWKGITAVNCGRGITLVGFPTGGEKDYILDGFNFSEMGTTDALTSTGIGVAIVGDVARPLPGVIISNGFIDGTEAEGLTSSYANELTVNNVQVYNPGQGGLSTRNRGFDIENSNRVKLIGCVAVDTQGSPTMDIGIYVDPTCVWPTIIGCNARGAITEQIRAWMAGTYLENFPGEATAVTTDATALDTRLRITLRTSDAVMVEVIAIAKEGTTNRAMYGKRALVYQDAGTLAQQQGATQDIFADIESDATWGGLSFGTFGATDTFRVRVTGKAATTINWTLHVRCMNIT